MNKKIVFYDKLIKLTLTDYQLKSNGFPQPHPNELSLAKIYNPQKHRLCHHGDGNNRYCWRCETPFTLDHYNETQLRSCLYHSKLYRIGDGLYKCISCGRLKTASGCQFADFHVHEYIDYNNLKGFINFKLNSNDSLIPSDNDIFAIDCESIYTTDGMEVARVTVLDINSKSVYDEFVKPITKIIDYNTEFSGIIEANLADITKTLPDVQQDLMKIFNTSTILIGHSLDSDLILLKIVHDKIVDTSILFPHPNGPPRKLALKILSESFLHRAIQNDGAKGHDSVEDAKACISLIKHYLQTHQE